jgi:hypothetical protein
LKNRPSWRWCKDWASSRRFARLMKFRANRKRRSMPSLHNSAHQTEKNKRRPGSISSRNIAASPSSSNRNLLTRDNSNLCKSDFRKKVILSKITTLWVKVRKRPSSINYPTTQLTTMMSLLEIP